MDNRPAQAFYDFKEYLKGRYDFISKMAAWKLCNEMEYGLTGRQVCDICNDLYDYS